MVYLMQPVDKVQPVMVNPDASIDALVDGLYALGLFADDVLDPEWLDADEPVVADGERLRRALLRYGEMADGGGVKPALEGTRGACAAHDMLGQFFAFVAETDGDALLIQHLI